MAYIKARPISHCHKYSTRALSAFRLSGPLRSATEREEGGGRETGEGKWRRGSEEKGEWGEGEKRGEGRWRRWIGERLREMTLKIKNVGE